MNGSVDLGLVMSKPSVEGRAGCYLATLQAPGLGSWLSKEIQDALLRTLARSHNISSNS